MAGAFVYEPMPVGTAYLAREAYLPRYQGYGQTAAIVGAVIGATVQAGAIAYQAYTDRITATQLRHAQERAEARAAEAAAQQAAAQQAAAIAAAEQARALQAEGATAEMQASGLSQPVGGIPVWGWAIGGVAGVGVLMLAMRRKR